MKCQICGKTITAQKRHVYCSERCADIGKTIMGKHYWTKGHGWKRESIITAIGYKRHEKYEMIQCEKCGAYYPVHNGVHDHSC